MFRGDKYIKFRDRQSIFDDIQTEDTLVAACIICNSHKGVFEMAGNGVCKACRKRELAEEKENSLKAPQQDETNIIQIARSIVLTTAFSVAGKEVDKEIDIVSAEVAIGMNLFKDFAASFKDIVGGRSNVTQKALKDARKVATLELRKEAARIGAHAVIGVDLDYQEMSAVSGGSMFFISINGTAVTLKK